MDKLDEREPGTEGSKVTTPALAAQFFLIPLAVVAVTALFYLGFRMLLTDERTAQEYLTEIRLGGANRRWPAAYELSRLMADPEIEKTNPLLVRGLIEAFEESADDDPMVRRYLALALGRLNVPASPEVIDALIKGLDDTDSETQINVIWALGSLQAEPAVAGLEQLYKSRDAGIRKMVVYALGAIPAGGDSSLLETALADVANDVRWNAAVALARHGRDEGVSVIREMLDREYLTQSVEANVQADVDTDPVGEVMISGLQAAAVLQESSLRGRVEEISVSDRSMRVRQAALDALKVFGDKASGLKLEVPEAGVIITNSNWRICSARQEGSING